MTAKLYGADDRALVIQLLSRLESEEQAIASLTGLLGESPIVVNVCDGDYQITIGELRDVFARRIDDITNTLRNKGIELAKAPGDSLPSIQRALDQQHELPAGNRVDENPTWEDRMKDNA
jgi:hypothetical protein